jgi:hypothetical protein
MEAYAKRRADRDEIYAQLYALDKRAPPSADRLASYRAYAAANPVVPLQPPPPDPRAKAKAGTSAERLASYRAYAAANPGAPPTPSSSRP